jgi:hypothetical protein
MSKVLINSSTLEDIADAIRAKTDTTEKLQPSQMATAIRSITGGSTTGDLYVSSSTPFRYRIVNPNPELQSLSIESSSSIDTTNQLVYTKLSHSIRGSVGYVVGIASKYYDSENNEYVFSITAPSLVADVTADGYTVIYANYTHYYLDYNESNGTSGNFNGKICVLKSVNSEWIDLSSNSGAVTEIYCPDITEFNHNGSDMFLDCFESSTKFKVILPNLLSIASDSWGLRYCDNLDKLYLPNVVSFNPSVINYSSNISLIDFGSVTSIGYDSSGFSANTIIIRTQNTVCSLDSWVDFNKVYVPDNLVNSYKTATNWSAMANKIYPLSEYVEGAE